MSDRLLHIINRKRVAHDRAPLQRRAHLDSYAHEHSRRMAEAGEQLFHSTPLRYAENVGFITANYWGALWRRRLVRAWMRSKGHRRNILGPYRTTGIGVVKADGLYWVTQVFD